MFIENNLCPAPPPPPVEMLFSPVKHYECFPNIFYDFTTLLTVFIDLIHYEVVNPDRFAFSELKLILFCPNIRTAEMNTLAIMIGQFFLISFI